LQIRHLLVKRWVIGRSLERGLRRFQRCTKSRRSDHRGPSGQLLLKAPHPVWMVKLAREGRIVECGVDRGQRCNLMPRGATQPARATVKRSPIRVGFALNDPCRKQLLYPFRNGEGQEVIAGEG